MDEFDRLLEYQLRRKLDAVVAGPVPVRRGQPRPRLLNIVSGESTRWSGGNPIQLRPDSFVFIEHS